MCALGVCALGEAGDAGEGALIKGGDDKDTQGSIVADVHRLLNCRNCTYLYRLFVSEVAWATCHCQIRTFQMEFSPSCPGRTLQVGECESAEPYRYLFETIGTGTMIDMVFSICELGTTSEARVRL